jgi:quinol monooxygenase YgiN
LAGAPTALVDAATGREIGREASHVEVMTIEYQATPFRAERFLELYRPGASRVLSYGATGFVLMRSEDDPDHIVHLSYWEDRKDFERYWFSREMQKVREQVAGLHGLPVLPHWNYVVERG